MKRMRKSKAAKKKKRRLNQASRSNKRNSRKMVRIIRSQVSKQLRMMSQKMIFNLQIRKTLIKKHQLNNKLSMKRTEVMLIPAVMKKIQRMRNINKRRRALPN